MAFAIAGLFAAGAWEVAARNRWSGEVAPVSTAAWLMKSRHVLGPGLALPATVPANRFLSSLLPLPGGDVAGASFAPQRLPAPEPFGLASERAPDGELWTKWRRVEAAIRDEMKIVAQCRASPDDCSSPAARRFIAIVDNARKFTGRARLAEINRVFNLAIRYVDDDEQHGVADFWASPLASLSSGKGDCEDYAIAKFVALREAGAADDDLRVVIVRDTTLNEHHAVLAARADGGWVVLENRRMALLGDGEAAHLVPMFAINRSIGVMQFVKAAPQRSRTAAAKIISSRT